MTPLFVQLLSHRFSFPLRVFIAVAITLPGCSDPPATEEAADVARTAAVQQSTTVTVTPEELKRQLNCWQAEFVMQGNEIREASLYQSGVRSIAPLKGLPLIALDLGMTQVADLAPLAGMPLQRLDLENTPISDISLLHGMPLSVLKMQNTRVTSFSPLEGLPLTQLNLLGLPFSDEHLPLLQNAPLQTVWLAGTLVTDLSGLPVTKLESLDIARTKVSSIVPLAAATRLKRLNIADTSVTDLTPLATLRLQRITLSPATITAGMDTLRSMTSLTQIQTDINEPLNAADFWQRFDLGLYKPDASQSPVSDSATTPQP
ncbi:MAG: leucine-rich repeat domain-containing protein [Planctomycetota bacterium]